MGRVIRESTVITNVSDHIRFQAEYHPIEYTGKFQSLEEYCLHLMHVKAYEEAAALANNKTVLDLGCNNGYGTVLLGQGHSKVVGLDVSARAIEDAQQRFRNYGIDFLVYDGQTIPFKAHAFDLIVSFQVIEHIADPTRYLAEIVRVLRPSGMALFTTPNAAIRLDPGMKPWNQFHVREYRADELSGLLQAVFAKVTIRGLFAIEDLYRIEFERCQGVLNAVRNRNSWRRKASTFIRDKGVSFLKVLLPARIIDYIRTLRTAAIKNTSAQILEENLIRRYSTRDIFYTTDNLDRALDLMAVCRVA